MIKICSYQEKHLSDLELHESNEEIRGLRGYGITSCQYVPLQGGCGSTIHCQSCTIPNSITYTLDTIQSQQNAPAYLNQEDQRIEYLISTEFKEEYVLLQIKKTFCILHVKNEPGVC